MTPGAQNNNNKETILVQKLYCVLSHAILICQILATKEQTEKLLGIIVVIREKKVICTNVFNLFNFIFHLLTRKMMLWSQLV